jgi:hypothetical protein
MLALLHTLMCMYAYMLSRVSELNTYLSTWRQDEAEPRPPPHLALVPTLHAAQLTEQLISMLATPLGIGKHTSTRVRLLLVR